MENINTSPTNLALRMTTGDGNVVTSVQDVLFREWMKKRTRLLQVQKQAVESWEKYEELRNINDLDKTIRFAKEMVNLITEDDNIDERQGCIHNLAMCLLKRFKHSGDLTNLEDAIALQQECIDMIPEDTSIPPGYLSLLGQCLLDRFKNLGHNVDIEIAIAFFEQAISDTPDGYSDKPGYLSNLGLSYQERFIWSGKLETEDIEHAILALQQAVNVTLGDDNDKSARLNDLAISLKIRFERFGEVADIDKAISLQQQAVDSAHHVTADKPSRLSNLGSLFLRRFEQFGEANDLDQSVLFKQQAVDLTLDGHPDKPGYLNNLGISFQRRFELFGDAVDIYKAIDLQQNVIDSSPKDDPFVPNYIGNLGSLLLTRYDHFKSVADLERAIYMLQHSINFIPDGHVDKPKHLNSLGVSFYQRFQKFGRLADITNAISVQQQAIDLIPDDYAQKPDYLSNLGNSLQDRFDRFGQVADIDEAISVQNQALYLISDAHNHSRKPDYLINLGNSFLSRFRKFGQVEDINQTILMQQKAVDLTPDGHISKPAYLKNLGISLSNRFESTSDVHHLQQALSYFSASASSSTGLPRTRLESAYGWACLIISAFPLIEPDSHFLSLQVGYIIMELVPCIASPGSIINVRYQNISYVGEAVNAAAAVACMLSRPDLALEWLDQGRSIVWSQMLRLRTPFDDLRRDHPELATLFEDISNRVELTSVGINNKTSNPSSIPKVGQLSYERDVQQHRRLAERWETLVQEIRQHPGYEKFLRSKTLDELASAAKSGPVIFVNIIGIEGQCSALVLQNINDLSLVDHIHLPLASLNKIKLAYAFFAHFLAQDGFKARTDDLLHLEPDYEAPADGSNNRASFPVYSQGDMKGALEMLWDTIVEPVIKKLGYMHKNIDSPTSTLPHVTWCTTGPLAFLPLHAAGRYGISIETMHEQTYNYMVSSYTSSISALIKEKTPSSSEFRGLAAISQPSTADGCLVRLPGTVEEVSKIKNLFLEKDFTWLNGPESTKDKVLETMGKSSWLHLACHGVQMNDNPMASAFMLYDGPLNLHTISQQNLSDARLAFLSACQTATGSESIPNEMAHLAGGLLMTGYHSVIGTMWSIKDQDAPLVAEEFYKYLDACNMKTENGEAAYALHEAVRRLREKVGTDQFARWVPFIHLGI